MELSVKVLEGIQKIYLRVATLSVVSRFVRYFVFYIFVSLAKSKQSIGVDLCPNTSFYLPICSFIEMQIL